MRVNVLLSPVESGLTLFTITTADVNEAPKPETVIEPTPDNTFAVDVEVVEPMGAESVVYLTAGTDALVASLDSATQAKENEKLQITLDMHKAHIFDKTSEKAITVV